MEIWVLRESDLYTMVSLKSGNPSSHMIHILWWEMSGHELLTSWCTPGVGFWKVIYQRRSTSQYIYMAKYISSLFLAATKQL